LLGDSGAKEAKKQGQDVFEHDIMLAPDELLATQIYGGSEKIRHASRGTLTP